MRRRLAAFSLGLSLSCAGGSETGNPAVPTSIGLRVQSSSPELVALRTGAESTVIDEAWVAFGQLAWLAPAQCGLLDSYPHLGPTLIAADLVSPDVRVKVDVKPGIYCGMVVPLENRTSELSADAPQPLHDHSIFVRGRRADGVPFTLAFPEQDELELAARGSFEVTRDTTLLLAFDVAVWMRDVDLGRAQVVDGSIRIDEEHNQALLRVFEANIDCSLELYEDTNGSGRLETGDKRLAQCSAN
jgi:hypothetical protein